MSTVVTKRVLSGAPWEEKFGYCRAIRKGTMIAVSGTTSMMDGKVFSPGNIEAQTRRCLHIIQEALRELGAKPSDVIRSRIFVTDISLAEDVARAHREFFLAHPPACTMVEVKALIMPELLVEIEVDAVVAATAK